MPKPEYTSKLPVPPHYDPKKVAEVWRVPYQERAGQAQEWAKVHNLSPTVGDAFKIALVCVDVQNTFCIPGFELFVAGRSGIGAVEDNQRLCEFIYHNLDVLTRIMVTMDTHQVVHIFHSIFLINERGEHPAPLTLVSYEDVKAGRWRFNTDLAGSLGIDPKFGQEHLVHYVKQLKEKSKYDLTIWPYHAMLGGIGHALVSSVEEAIFFHSMARRSQPEFEVKGRNPLTEHYSAIQPEVMEGPHGENIGQKSGKFISLVQEFDAVVIAGQAKSHCVSWTIDDILEDILARDAALAGKVYLLADCTSPVVVPGVIDYTEQAEASFCKFADAGMHLVRSTEPISAWLKQPIG